MSAPVPLMKSRAWRSVVVVRDHRPARDLWVLAGGCHGLLRRRASHGRSSDVAVSQRRVGAAGSSCTGGNRTRQGLVEGALRTQRRAVERDHGPRRTPRAAVLGWSGGGATCRSPALDPGERDGGQKGRFSGRYQPPASRASARGPQRRRAAAPVLQVEREQPGRWRQRRARPRPRAVAPARPRRRTPPPRSVRRRLVLPAEEDQRHVKRPGHRAQVARRPRARRASGDPAALVLRQVERHEHPRGARQGSPARLAAEQPPQQVHGDRGRAVADLGPVARQAHVRGSRAPVRELHAPADGADRLLLGSAAGPATPVIATAVSAPNRSSAPSAIASATGSETAPCCSISAGSTPSSSDFASLAYATTPPATYSDEPGPLGQARRQQPAGARLRGGDPCGRRAAAATWSSTSEPSVEKSVPVALARRSVDQLRVARRASGS